MNYLTREFQGHSVGFPAQQIDASLLNPAGCCYSDPALLD